MVIRQLAESIAVLPAKQGRRQATSRSVGLRNNMVFTGGPGMFGKSRTVRAPPASIGDLGLLTPAAPTGWSS